MKDQPTISPRPYQSDTDFRMLRQLSIDTFPVTGPGWNWDIRRWDGTRFHNADPEHISERLRVMGIWEAPDGQIVGAVHPEDAGWLFLQLHPAYRYLEEEMIAWAEQNLSITQPGGSRALHFEVYDYDAPRQRILEARGYQNTGRGGVLRRMYLTGQEQPARPLAHGYTLREINADDLQDCQRLADLLNASFGRTFHNAEEFYHFARQAPSYRADLHLVAAAPDGSFAAHAAGIYDEANRRGLYEPVCTSPDHRRKNLAQGLMQELLQRMQALGARQLTVETGEMPPANALYDAFGFTEVYRLGVWRKEWPAA